MYHPMHIVLGWPIHAPDLMHLLFLRISKFYLYIVALLCSVALSGKLPLSSMDVLMRLALRKKKTVMFAWGSLFSCWCWDHSQSLQFVWLNQGLLSDKHCVRPLIELTCSQWDPLQDRSQHWNCPLLPLEFTKRLVHRMSLLWLIVRKSQILTLGDLGFNQDVIDLKKIKNKKKSQLFVFSAQMSLSILIVALCLFYADLSSLTSQQDRALTER